jgi:hypothetical protein
MKVRTFAENLFASVSLVKQEPGDHKFHTTADEDYALKKGDLVLLARTKNDKEIEYAILAKVYQLISNSKAFYALSDGGMKILFPAPIKRNWRDYGLPPAIRSSDFDGCQYLMRDSMVDHPPKDAWCIFGPKYLTDNRIYIGFENVMGFLLTTPGMEPHAGALAISWMMSENVT